MAEIGQSLDTSEAGWTRIDASNDSEVQLYGDAYKNSNDPPTLIIFSSAGGLRYRFYGTGIRLVTFKFGTTYRVGRITIDGVSTDFNMIYDGVPYPMTYENLELSEGWHDVEITCGDTSKANIRYIDILEVKRRYLLKVGEEYQTYGSTGLKSLGTSLPSEETFLSEGITDFTSIPPETFSSVGSDLEVVYFDNKKTHSSLKVGGEPKEQTVLPLNQAIIPGTSRIRGIGIVGDGNARYLIRRNSEWYGMSSGKLVQSGPERIVDEGIPIQQEIGFEMLETLGWGTGTISFCYWLDSTGMIDEISVEYSPFGGWKSLPAGRSVRTIFDLNGNLKVEVYESGDYKVNYPKPKPKSTDEEFWEEFDI
jgi:hypothetical protein